MPVNRGYLSPRQTQTLELIGEGLDNKAIAEKLGIKPGTVKIFVKQLFDKMGVNRRTDLLRPPAPDPVRTQGQVAYEAYRWASPGLLPVWVELDSRMREAWEGAVSAVAVT